MGRGDEGRNEAWVRAGTREEQLRVVKGKEKEAGIDMEECQREVWGYEGRNSNLLDKKKTKKQCYLCCVASE